jgi:hypothetical protein
MQSSVQIRQRQFRLSRGPTQKVVEIVSNTASEYA